MAVFDHQLGRIMGYMRSHPETVLIVASSMGQSAVQPTAMNMCYLVKDPRRLASALGLGDAQEGLAMYPRSTLEFASDAAAMAAAPVLSSIRCGERPLFDDVRQDGKTVSCAIRVELGPDEAGGGGVARHLERRRSSDLAAWRPRA